MADDSDYRDWSDDQLLVAKASIEEELSSRITQRRREMFIEVMTFNCDDYVKALAAAMVDYYKLVDLREYKEKLPCRLEDLGYYLAKHRINKLSADSPLLTDQLSLWLRITAEFNEVDYIFATTHFDECSNGQFFRRS